MRHAGHIVALVHQKMREVIEPGISTKELDSIAFNIIKKERAVPTFLGYQGSRVLFVHLLMSRLSMVFLMRL